MNNSISHGYLYLADLNPRMGSESGKIRPVLVIQTNYLNETAHPSTWILPCTSKLTEENLLRVRLPKGIAENSEDCEVMIDQSCSIDNKRFRKALGPLPKVLLNEVKEKLRLLADL